MINYVSITPNYKNNSHFHGKIIVSIYQKEEETASIPVMLKVVMGTNNKSTKVLRERVNVTQIMAKVSHY
ncbi:hypothetical protein MTBBW1_1630055 [Desulfamplus magnetovallimortis]|uniref:Uncharacterized protein n=1 Tax=Desulfamplus magnetovallimortis TaxID=1246637 RepID=A0A1W1H962_9BACT|nr:hypothetical protein MTBBW1_1630055 [Desulfamplus magnetovallimortis]